MLTDDAATKVIVGTGGGPGQEIGLSQQSPDEPPCKAGRHIVVGVGQKKYHSSGDFDGSVFGERVGPSKASETKSLEQGMLNHNDTGIMGSERVVHAKGQGVSDGSV